MDPAVHPASNDPFGLGRRSKVWGVCQHALWNYMSICEQGNLLSYHSGNRVGGRCVKNKSGAESRTRSHAAPTGSALAPHSCRTAVAGGAGMDGHRRWKYGGFGVLLQHNMSVCDACFEEKEEKAARSSFGLCMTLASLRLLSPCAVGRFKPGR